MMGSEGEDVPHAAEAAPLPFDSRGASVHQQAASNSYPHYHQQRQVAIPGFEYAEQGMLHPVPQQQHQQQIFQQHQHLQQHYLQQHQQQHDLHHPQQPFLHSGFRPPPPGVGPPIRYPEHLGQHHVAAPAAAKHHGNPGGQSFGPYAPPFHPAGVFLPHALPFVGQPGMHQPVRTPPRKGSYAQDGAVGAFGRMSLSGSPMTTRPPIGRGGEPSSSSSTSWDEAQQHRPTVVGANTLPAKPEFVAVPSPSIPVQSGGASNVLAANTMRRIPSSVGAGSGAVPAIAPTVPLVARLPALPPRPPHDGATADELAVSYGEREDALLLRIEAIGFEPEAAWKVMREIEEGKVGDDSSAQAHYPAPILGIRLLQRLDVLQKENDELGRLLEERIVVPGGTIASRLTSELEDAHQLIGELDAALLASTARTEAAEARVAAQERALAIACAQTSSSIVTSGAKSGTTGSTTTSSGPTSPTIRRADGGGTAWKR